MRFALHRPALALLFVLAAGAVPSPLRSQAPAAAVQAPDYAAVLGDFPRPGSEAAGEERAILLWEQRSRTPEDVRRAKLEEGRGIEVFSEVTGKDLAAGPYPRTRALFEHAEADAERVVGGLKHAFNRPRPFRAMADLHPVVHQPKGNSFPSGHSTWGMVGATVLAALDPAGQEAILARGRLVGYDRVLAGVHYPSDVEAGQRLGAAFAAQWLAAPEHRQELEAARREW